MRGGTVRKSVPKCRNSNGVDTSVDAARMSASHECAMPLSFPTTAHLHKLWGRPWADPLVYGRRPRRPAGVCTMLISLFRLRDEGVPRGPGGPPSNYAESAALRKLSGIAHSCAHS